MLTDSKVEAGAQFIRFPFNIQRWFDFAREPFYHPETSDHECGEEISNANAFVITLYYIFQVSEDVLVERVVGRRLDPVTGKIYHLKYSPPENEEIAARLTQRFDDTEEKA